MTRYFLGLIDFDQSTQPSREKAHNFLFTNELPEQQYMELSNSLKTISKFLTESEVFNITVLNYINFIDLIKDYLFAYINKEFDIFYDKPINININRSFLNFLSSTRSYLDFMDRSLHKRYGKNSTIYRNYKKYTNEEYDSNFSYRFLYNLRHYAQHKGFPIGSISWGQKPIKNSQDKPEYFLKVSIVRNEILKDFEWRKLEPDITRQPELIDPRLHAELFIKSLSRIHVKVMFNIFFTLKEDANLILDYSTELVDKKGTPVVFELGGDVSNVGELKHVLIPVNIAKKISMGNFDGLFTP